MSAPGKSRRGRRWRGWLWKLPLAFVAFSVLQVLALRFIDPPFSMFMAARQLDAAIAGDFGFRIAHDWRGMEPDLAEPAAGAGGFGRPELRKPPWLRFRRHRKGAGAQQRSSARRSAANLFAACAVPARSAGGPQTCSCGRAAA